MAFAPLRLWLVLLVGEDDDDDNDDVFGLGCRRLVIVVVVFAFNGRMMMSYCSVAVRDVWSGTVTRKNKGGRKLSFGNSTGGRDGRPNFLDISRIRRL
jgi:hypothetical protein